MQRDYPPLKKYMSHIRNSVFEGELTKAQLIKLKQELKSYINMDKNSVVLFKSRQEKWLDKEFLGKVDDKTSFIL